MWVGVLVNFNSHYNDIFKFYSILIDSDNKISIKIFINLIRSISLYLILLFILFFFAKDVFYKKSFVINLLLIYIFIQFISFIINRDLLEEIDQTYFWLNYLMILIFFYSMNSIFNKKQLDYFFFVLMIFILIVVTILLMNMYSDIFNNKYNSFYYSYFVSPESRFMEQGVPRVTGIARILLLLVIFNGLILINCKNKIFSFTILLILTGSLFLTQARSSIWAFIIIGSFLCLFDKNYSFLKKILIFLILITVCSTYQIMFPEIKGAIKSYNSFVSEDIEFEKDDKSKLNNKDCDKNLGLAKCEREIIRKNWEEHRDTHGSLEYRVRMLEDFNSSGRVNDWKKLINFSKEKIFIGYGFQADRFLIKTSASNSYVYSLISSGVVGLIIIITIVLITINKYIKIIFFEKLFYKKGLIIYKSCFLINVLILLRTAVESSFAVYNFDLALFLLTFLYLEKYETNT